MLRAARVEYVMVYGWSMPWPRQQAYIEGRITPGMSSELVEILYGEPDLVILCPRQNLICDRVWVYEANDIHAVGSVSIRGGYRGRSIGANG